MVAQYFGTVAEKMRIVLSAEAKRRRSELSLHMKCLIEPAKASERVMVRVVARERVVRMRSFCPTIVTRKRPSGLGKECAEARALLVRSKHYKIEKHTLERP